MRKEKANPPQSALACASANGTSKKAAIQKEE